MPPGTPTMRWTKAHPASSMIETHWTPPSPTTSDMYVEVYRNAGGGAYALAYTYQDESTQYCYDYGRSDNVTYGYKVRYCTSGANGDFSGASTKTLWSGTYTDTITMTESVLQSGSQSASYTYQDYITMTDAVTHAVTINHTVSETVTMSDSVVDSQTAKVDYAYYVGRSDGDICAFDTVYNGDDSEIITASWTSKVTDFADQYYGLADQYKCVYSVKLIYEDLEAVNVTMLVSNDGGVTWTESLKSVGSGDKAAKAKEFFFIKHGQYFQFKIVHASASTTFKWLGLEIEFEPTGSFYAI